MGLQQGIISNLCACCLQTQGQVLLTGSATWVKRSLHSVSPLQQDGALQQSNESETEVLRDDDNKEEDAMSRRLAEMTEAAILEGGRSARRNMQQVGFSEELKKQLEGRIGESSFRSENAAAFSISNMPSSTGRGTQDLAAAPPWKGTESLHDATLRMLNDSKKPLHSQHKLPQPAPVAPSPKPASSTGHRLADARDRTSTYVLSQSHSLTDREREALRSELRQRFDSGARSLPMTIQGLSSLANERIEDAMARGLFKNVPRGKNTHVEKDHNASSAFIDTTEYFMNKIIQKQEIVPPWIEKQQELAKEIDRFRQRLRSGWKRHAARLIASKGGSLQEQMKHARAYAAAEVLLTEKRRLQFSSQNGGDVKPCFTQINHEGRLSSKQGSQTTSQGLPKDLNTSDIPNFRPLRDPEYLSIERGYHELQVKTINDLTRLYNLQAPRPAQKPYLNLERELNYCYADVAPRLADEIHRRATERVRETTMHSDAKMFGMPDILTPNQSVQVYDEDSSKGYGLKEFWKDFCDYFWGANRQRSN